MQLLPAAACQRTVRDVLQQGVLECVFCIWWHAAAENDARRDERVQRAFELLAAQRCHGDDQLVRELAPDRGPDLSDRSGLSEPVEPRHQRGVQACRNRKSRRRDRRDRAPGRSHALCFQNRLRHLLHEQGNAVGALEDFRQYVRRQLIVPDQTRNNDGRSRSPSRLSVSFVEPLECPTHGAVNSGRNVTMSSAGNVLIWSTIRPSTSRLVGSIPMRILGDNQNRLLPGQSREL